MSVSIVQCGGIYRKRGTNSYFQVIQKYRLENEMHVRAINISTDKEIRMVLCDFNAFYEYCDYDNLAKALGSLLGD